MSYAVKIPFDDVMLYVTEGDSKFHLRSRMFETHEQAQQHAALWGGGAVVVKYPSEQNSSHEE